MSPEPKALPGFWRFTWLLFLKPITLHRLLRELGVDPREPLWKALRRRSPSDRWWRKRCAQMLFLFMPSAALLISGIAAAYGLRVDWLRVAVGVPVGVTSGVASAVALGVAFGVASAEAFGGAFLVASVSAVVAFGVASAEAFGVALGVAFGVAFGVALGVAFGVASGVAGGVAFGVVSGVAVGVAVDVAVGLVGVVGGLACAVTFLRLPVLVLEVIVQSAAWHWHSATKRSTLAWVPVLYHELSYLPHPFLERHVLAEADDDPELTRRVLEACAIAPGQRRTGRRVEAFLRARELKRLVELQDFSAIATLRGSWLPGIQGADTLLLGFSEAGRCAVAAHAAFNPHHRLKHLDGLMQQLTAIENQIRSHRDALTSPFEEPLEALRAAGSQMRAEARKSAAGLIPNPFRADQPLSGEEGPELFRGRESAVRRIEEILSDPDRSASLQVLAPRRSGKTTLLKMLPHKLPDAVCVFFDLQAHPAASAGAFWEKLAEQAIIQAKRDRRVDLPKLPAGPLLEAASSWLEQLDQLPGGRRVLLAIDEFERLEELFPGNRREFLQLMGLFRATIQHGRRVRLLISGAAPFEELDRVWDDHFISLQRISLPFFDPPTSAGLLTEPAPEFPRDTIPEEVARVIHRLTGGQPYLLQIFGSLLVSRLNEERRRNVTIDDVRAVEGRAIEWAEAYFRDMYRSAPEAAREVLMQLARGETAGVPPAARRWLDQRYLLTEDGQLSIPLFGAWMGHHMLV